MVEGQLNTHMFMIEATRLIKINIAPCKVSGITSSTAYVSLETRFNIRPLGVISKNIIL